MPENEFEKEVQQKLEQFAINPSNEPWSKIAVSIGKQKKRRRKAGLYFIIFCFLLVGALFMPMNKIYFFQNRTDKMPPALGTTIIAIDKINTTTKKRIIADKILAGKTINAIDKINTPTKERLIADKTLAGKTIIAIDKTNTPTKERLIADKTLAGKTIIAIDKTNTPTKERSIADQAPPVLVKKRRLSKVVNIMDSLKRVQKDSVNFKAVNTKRSMLSVRKKINTAGKKIITITEATVGEMKDTLIVVIEANKKHAAVINNFTPQNSVNNTDSLTAFCTSKMVLDTVKIAVATILKNREKITITKKNKWLFGVAATIGKAAADNIFLSSNNRSAYNYASPVTGNIGGQPLVYQPSVIKSGFGFSLGAAATKKIGLKTTIILGINYKLLTNGLLVGRQTVLSNGINYSVGNLKNYRNAFHFIELPVTLQHQIFSIKKRPVLLDGGLSVAQLFYTNALEFNFAQGNYYTDNAIFNKTIIGFSAGISCKINNSKSAPLLLGVHVYYSATNIANTGLYNKSQYSFAGISLKKSFSKN